MRHLILTFLAFMALTALHAQKGFEVKTQEGENDVTYIGHNPTSQDVYVTLDFEGQGFSADRENGIEQLVPANSETVLMVLTFKSNESISISMSSSYRMESSSAAATESGAEVMMDFKGITVFSKNDCARCLYTKQFLRENFKAFKDLNISENKAYEMLMWAKLKDEGKEGDKLYTPVVVVDDKVYYNIEDLEGFLKKLL